MLMLLSGQTGFRAALAGLPVFQDAKNSCQGYSLRRRMLQKILNTWRYLPVVSSLRAFLHGLFLLMGWHASVLQKSRMISLRGITSKSSSYTLLLHQGIEVLGQNMFLEVSRWAHLLRPLKKM